MLSYLKGKEIFDLLKTNIENDHNHFFVSHQNSIRAQTILKSKIS